MLRLSIATAATLAATAMLFAALAAVGDPAPLDEAAAARRLADAPPVATAAAPRLEPAPLVADRPTPDAAQRVAQRIDIGRWDTDLDGLVDPAEFSRGLFEMVDRDGDQRVSAGEFEAARAWLPGEPGPDTIALWDDDADGLLEPRAFTSGLIVDGLAHAWDRDGDGRLRRPEIAAGLEAAFDRDGDGDLEPDEQAPIARADR